MQISIYTVEDTPIGCGGMGNVYLGYDPNGNKVAIKEMRAEFLTDANLRDRFRQEIKLMEKFDHPFIVNMYAAFPENHNMYLVMEYVDGVTLEKYVSHRGVLAESDAVSIIEKVLDALQYIHRHSIVHRDIKPSNIMIREDGRVCLLDFGIAKDLDSNRLTQGMLAIGTNGYMSPEQAEGLSINHLSDIYSLGCVLYYMLTGKHAVVAQSNDHATRMAIIQDTIPDVRLSNPNTSDFIVGILRKATDKNMTLRFQSCSEFQMKLKNNTGGTNGGEGRCINKISVGRVGCDITIYDPNRMISSHHADILKEECTGVPIGTTRYIYVDRSTNGTLVNGKKVHNSQIEISIPEYTSQDPQIYLACQYPDQYPEYQLNWRNVVEAFHNKENAGEIIREKEPPKREEESATEWLIAIYIFALLGGLLGVIFGMNLYREKVDLADGSKVYKYKESHRNIALAGVILSAISLIVWVVILTM